MSKATEQPTIMNLMAWSTEVWSKARWRQQLDAVSRAISAAPAVPALPVQASVSDGTLHVVAEPPPGSHAVLAVWEDGLVTQVTDGENDGETLVDDRVGRALVSLDAGGRARVRLDPTWRRVALGAAVLAHGDDRRIVAAAALTMP